MADPIEIGSSFQNRAEKAVAKGVMVRYSIANLKMSSSEGRYDAPSNNWQWWLTYNYLGDNGESPRTKNPQRDDMGNSNLHTDFYWKFGEVGKHRVNCRGQVPGAKEWTRYGSYAQEVAELKTILQRQTAISRTHDLPDPLAESKFVKKYADLLYAAGERGSRVTEMFQYVTKLEALLNKCDRNNIIPFRATYLAEESMEVAELRIFLTYPAGRDDKRMIVDWTNLDEPRLSETYEADVPKPVMYDGTGAGAGADPDTTKRLAEDPGKLWAQGVRQAVDKWKSKNRYWPGGVQYELWVRHKATKTVVNIKDTFTTGGKGFTETLAEWLKKIGFYVAMFALVLTGVGSGAAGAIMVLSMVAAATGAVLSIQQRHSKGESDALADAMDVLDIAANCLGVGGKVGEKILWKAGRTISVETAGAKAVQYMFIGQKYANGFSGILIGVSFAKRYNEIMENKTMTAGQRTDALLKLFEEAAKAAGLHVVNQKIATSAEKAQWEKLLERDAVPRPVDSDPHVGTGGKGTKVPDSDGVPQNPIKDGDSGPHVVPSDGVPRVEGPAGDSTGKVPVRGSGPTDKIKTSDKTTDPPKANTDADKTAPLRVTDKPGFKGDTKDKQKKVTVADKQQRNPSGGVPVANPPPSSPAKVGVLKRLALGLNWYNKNISYVKWAKRKGYNLYDELGKTGGGFDGQVRDALKTADEIHFNLDGVDLSKVKKVDIDSHGMPESANWTNHELWLISTNGDYAKKVKWWNADKMAPADHVRKVETPDTVQPDGWWPPGLNDPRTK